jgi:hypothetical protein
MTYVKSPKELGLKTDCQGIYIDTTMPRIDAMISTGFLEFGVGQTREDAEHSTIASRMDGHTSSKNLKWQHYLLDSIPTPGYSDYDLHKVIRQTFAAQLQDPNTGKKNEVFRVAVEQMQIEKFAKTKDFEPIRVWLNEKIRKCAAKLNPDHEKQAVNLRDVQTLVIKKVLTALRQNGIVTNFVCELAARIGKTILFLSLAKSMREEFGHESMFIKAYGVGLSVKTSYKDEIGKYNDFAGMRFIDAADADSYLQYKQAVAEGKMPIVFVSLNPEAEEKYEWINQLTGTHIALLEETDFGTHTDSQVEKVEYLLANKTVTRINASGTNIGRLAKAFGKNAIDEIISVPYCMVEQDPSIPNVVVRRFYNMLFNPKMNKLLEDFDKDVLPNITKVLSKPLSQQKFISALFQDIFGYQPIYGFNISDQAGEEILHSMLFVNIKKQAGMKEHPMDQLAQVIEKACPEHKVLILNGDYTDNKEAEGVTKEELVRLKNGYYSGRNKLLVITNMMGTRSYSIPEIQACLFMQEGGDVYPYMQKYSRCLTPDEHGKKKLGHIFDFAFDQSKTRNSVMSVAVEAALLIRQKGKTYPEAVREVLNSVNIKDMISGQWMDADTIIKEFEDNNKLLEIANAHTRITIEDLTSEEIEAFGELAKRSSGSKAERSKIDKTIATGKTFDSGQTASGRPKKNPLKAIVEKAIRMINGSATTVLALSNYQGETFLECVDIIDADAEMSREFCELYGVYPNTIKRLSDRLEIPTLDMIVRMSKYNKQKHIENNALAILKDDLKLWFDIFGNRELKRFIKSKKCRSILVAAGGHGSEIDVLVDMFGIEIVDKIVYNDKYSFLCNQIKRKYPAITVVKGDFTELEFGMKFDVVVGNPPYQDPNNDKRMLWNQIVDKAVEVTTEDGYIAIVTPTTWLTAKTNIHNSYKMFEEKQVERAVIFDKEDKPFDEGTSVSYTIVKNTKRNRPTPLYFAQYSTGIETHVADVNIAKDKIWPGQLSPINLAIHHKLQPHKKIKFLKSCEFHNQKLKKKKMVSDVKDSVFQYTHYVSAAITRYTSTKFSNHDTWKVMVPLTSTIDKAVVDNNCGHGEDMLSLYVDDQSTASNIKTLFNTRFYKFIGMLYKNGRNQPLQNLFPVIDFTKIWTDKELYAHFGLTQEEIDYIEANVK